MVEAVQTKDVLPVRSRVSWQAIVAGAVVALAIYVLLGMLGVALGLSISPNVNDQELGIGAAIWAILVTLIALFLGGWVSSQVTVGENKMESVIYGILVWGVFFTAVFWLTGGALKLGFNALIGIANSPATAAVIDRLPERELREAGISQEQINRLRQKATNWKNEIRETAQDPRIQEAAWWALGGIFLSMIAAVSGAVLGAGPTLWIAGVRVRTTPVEPGVPTR
jgi:hypothetical protein